MAVRSGAWRHETLLGVCMDCHNTGAVLCPQQSRLLQGRHAWHRRQDWYRHRHCVAFRRSVRQAHGRRGACGRPALDGHDHRRTGCRIHTHGVRGRHALCPWHRYEYGHLHSPDSGSLSCRALPRGRPGHAGPRHSVGGGVRRQPRTHLRHHHRLRLHTRGDDA